MAAEGTPIKIRNVLIALASAAMLLADAVRAQDVPGIEICTVEKDMVRRTSCLQSNVDFLKKTMTQAAGEGQRKIDAAMRQIEALKASVAALQKAVEDLQAAQQKQQPPPASAKENVKDGGKDAAKDAAKDGAGDSKK